MKKSCTLILSVLLALQVLTGCRGDKVNEPTELPEDAYIYDLFTTDGNVYALRDDGKHTYISTEFSDEPVCYQLPGDSDAVWHAPSGRLYYGDGCGIYSCDLTGNDRMLLWELPDGTRKDYARVEAIFDDWIFICVGYGNTYRYFALNLNTGEDQAILGVSLAGTPAIRDSLDTSTSYTGLPEVLCLYGDTLLYLQKNRTDTISVWSASLSSGEITQLGSFSSNGNPGSCGGFVREDTLYFNNSNYSFIYSVPLSGGEVAFIPLDTEQADGMTLLTQLREVDGTVYVLMRDGTTYHNAMLCELDIDSKALRAVDEEKRTLPEAEGFWIDKDQYFIFSRTAIASGELSHETKTA